MASVNLKHNDVSDDRSRELQFSRLCVVDSEKSSNNVALVNLYSLGRGERFISSVKMFACRVEDPQLAQVTRFVFLHGDGNKFVMPDTRLELDVEDFWRGVVNAYVCKSYVPGLFKPGRITGIERICYISQVTKIGDYSGSNAMFSVLSREEAREFRDERKKSQKAKKSSKSSEVSAASEQKSTGAIRKTPASAKEG